LDKSTLKQGCKKEQAVVGRITGSQFVSI